jgi:hypothetical protein
MNFLKIQYLNICVLYNRPISLSVTYYPHFEHSSHFDAQQLQLIYDLQSVGQSVLVSGVHLGPVTNFSFSSKFPSDSCVFVIL